MVSIATKMKSNLEEKLSYVDTMIKKKKKKDPIEHAMECWDISNEF